MEEGSITWVVTADAAEARIFCERARTGPLRELTDLRMAATEEERAADHHHRGNERADGHEAERRFLRRVATRVALGARRGEFERLVLMGPPRAIGLLRKALPAAVEARIDATDPHERKGDDPNALRLHLRQARARTWA